MLILVITTQDHENYAAHDWDGQGQCPQRWKAKGGSDYHLPLTLELASQGQEALRKLVGTISTGIVEDGDYFTTDVTGWSIEDSDVYRPWLFDSYMEHGDAFPLYEVDLLGQTYKREIDHWPY